MPKQTQLISCGALLYSTTTKRYLFLLRDNGSYANTWALPGGKMLPNENILTGLTREIFEEIGLCTFDKVIPIEQFTSDNASFVYHTFLIPIQNEFVPVLNNEHKGYCWVRLPNYPKPLHPGVWRTVNFESVIDKIKTFEQVVAA